MTYVGWFQIALSLALVMAAAYPIGAFMADVFEKHGTVLTPLLGPIERAFYRLAGIDSKAEQEWREYAIAMVVFGGACRWWALPPTTFSIPRWRSRSRSR